MELYNKTHRNAMIICGRFLTNKFKKSVDLSYARNFDLHLLYEVIELLAQDKPLPEKTTLTD